MLPLTSTHWYTWQINFGGLNTDNMNEMSGTGAKLTEGALKLGRALGVLENPKVRCYAGIMKICINLTFFFPQSSAAMKQTEKYVQNAMKNKLCVKCLLFFSWMGNSHLSCVIWMQPVAAMNLAMSPCEIGRSVIALMEVIQKAPDVAVDTLCRLSSLYQTARDWIMFPQFIVTWTHNRWRVQSAAHSGNLVESVVTLLRLLACLLVCLLVCWLIDLFIYHLIYLIDNWYYFYLAVFDGA